jgi:catechol 2,3-dioxygenase
MPDRYEAHLTEEEIDRTLEQTFPASDPLGSWRGREESGAPAWEKEMRQDTVVRPIDPGVDIGHVHLKVSDLERALAFYCGVLGFELTQRYGEDAAFVSAGGYHHHIGLNTWESKGGVPPPTGTTGLYHVAIRYPNRAALADALRRLLKAGISLDGASDHGVSEALYLRDPDGNGIELYCDRPEREWPHAPDGSLAMVSRRLDLEMVLREDGVEELAELALKSRNGPRDP